jgi:hypothetical protein
VDTPREEHSFLSQKDPQPGGRQILLDIAFIVEFSNIHLGGIDAKAENTFVSRGKPRFSRQCLETSASRYILLS